MYKKSNQSFIQECLDVKDQVVKDGKGRNVIPPPERESLWKLYLEKFKDPIIIVLIVAFALSLCLAFYEVVVMDYSWSVLFEPVGVLLALLLATGVGFIFEVKAGKEFDILNRVKDSRPVKVLRCRERGSRPMGESIAKQDDVVGDIVRLESGDEIPADGILLEATQLRVDESNFTGETYANKYVDEADFDKDATYGKSWGLKDFLEGWGKRMIVVGIECGHDGQERLSEYLPYPAQGYFGQFEPWGEKTMDWIVHEIKPMIDAEYRTLPDRANTGIGGSSMGGIMSLYGAVCYNTYFSKAACVSSAVGFCIRRVLKDIRQQEISPDTRVYLSWGTKESFGGRASRWNRAIEAELKNCGCATLRYCQHGGKHCEADWEKLVPEFMNFLWNE